MKDEQIYQDVKRRLDIYQREIELPGISDAESEYCFIRQFIDSYKRIKYISLLKTRALNAERKNPNSDIYDPIHASILHLNEGDTNESVWNILLYVHFGKNIRSKYGLIKAVYGKLGAHDIWSWNNISNNLVGFQQWLDENIAEIKSHGSFGNHRKYQSLKISARSGTFQTFQSFFNLVNNDFNSFISTIPIEIRADKNLCFDFLYSHFVNIQGFGRLAVFDFLCMVGKVGILEIEPSGPYLGNDGPINGTMLLFDSTAKTKDLNDFLKHMGNHAFTDYPFVMQILEDCVCNWQKSPRNYRLFGG